MPVDKKELIKILKKIEETSKKRNFTESVELTVNFKDIDLKKPENRINTELVLPNEIEEEARICVIASGELAVKAKELNVNVLDKDELQGLTGNKKAMRKLAKSFDFFVASVDLMPLVGRILGAVLGPRGKMPKPIPPNTDLKSIIENYKRTVRLRMRDNPCLHAKVGVRGMDEEKLAENITAVISFLEEKLERGPNSIKSIYVKTTMGSPVRVPYVRGKR
ncbi:MAG: 50S ribosomal protein L1 [Candidatus Freyarchaeota archaeon]|nr:50S ribosomal protein L1 [Candidatus Jordarchaeia archaeon]